MGGLHAAPGRDTSQILHAVLNGDIGALLVAAMDPGDLPDPAAALAAVEAAGFVVSLELRVSPVTDRADVVLGSRPSPRRPAPSSTGRAGSARSRRR